MKYILLLFSLYSCFTAANDETSGLTQFDIWLETAFENKSFKDQKAIDSLGKPISEKINVEQPDRIGGPLENVQLELDGLNLCYLREKDSENRVWLYSIEVTSKQWRIGESIKTGDPISVLEKYKKFYDPKANEYCGNSNCLRVKSNDGIINSIHIELYVD